MKCKHLSIYLQIEIHLSFPKKMLMETFVSDLLLDSFFVYGAYNLFSLKKIQY